MFTRAGHFKRAPNASPYESLPKFSSTVVVLGPGNFLLSTVRTSSVSLHVERLYSLNAGLSSEVFMAYDNVQKEIGKRYLQYVYSHLTTGTSNPAFSVLTQLSSIKEPTK